MNYYITQFYDAINFLEKNIEIILVIVGSLYVIHFVNVIVGHRLTYLGIYPRRPWGLIGIVFSPFIHGNFNHLFFNSIPLFVLASFVLLNGLPTFIFVSVTIILLSGIATWALARKGFHIGRKPASSWAILGFYY